MPLFTSRCSCDLSGYAASTIERVFQAPSTGRLSFHIQATYLRTETGSDNVTLLPVFHPHYLSESNGSAFEDKTFYPEVPLELPVLIPRASSAVPGGSNPTTGTTSVAKPPPREDSGATLVSRASGTSSDLRAAALASVASLYDLPEFSTPVRKSPRSGGVGVSLFAKGPPSTPAKGPCLDVASSPVRPVSRRGASKGNVEPQGASQGLKRYRSEVLVDEASGPRPKKRSRAE